VKQYIPDQDVICPDDSDKPREVVPEGETVESYCYIPDQDVICPDDSDKPRELVPVNSRELLLYTRPRRYLS
jgi:hypothetical protein